AARATSRMVTPCRASCSARTTRWPTSRLRIGGGSVHPSVACHFHCKDVAATQDAPHASGGPALVGLRRLLEAIGDAVHHHLNDRLIDRQAAIDVAAQEFGETAGQAA